MKNICYKCGDPVALQICSTWKENTIFFSLMWVCDNCKIAHYFKEA